MLSVFVRALRSAYRRQAKRRGRSGGEIGMATSVQRFGGSPNLHVHFYTLVLDGMTPVTVQLVISTGATTECWQTTAALVDSTELFNAKGP